MGKEVNLRNVILFGTAAFTLGLLLSSIGIVYSIKLSYWIGAGLTAIGAVSLVGALLYISAEVD